MQSVVQLFYLEQSELENTLNFMQVMRPCKKDTLCSDVIQQIMRPEVFQDLMFLVKKGGKKKKTKENLSLWEIGGWRLLRIHASITLIN